MEHSEADWRDNFDGDWQSEAKKAIDDRQRRQLDVVSFYIFRVKCAKRVCFYTLRRHNRWPQCVSVNDDLSLRIEPIVFHKEHTTFYPKTFLFSSIFWRCHRHWAVCFLSIIRIHLMLVRCEPINDRKQKYMDIDCAQSGTPSHP